MMKINPMKNFNIIYLLFIIPILYGCTSAEASSGNLPSVTNSSAMVESTKETISVEDESKTEKEIQDIYSETNSEGIRLELADVSGSDPIYSLAFKKQDTNTGNYLNYADLNSEASDNSDDLENIDIKVEPNCYFGYWLDSEDRLCLSICNIEGNDSIKVMIDGLEYTFSPNREKQEERVLNKSIEVKGESVLIEKAVFYPEYIALYLSEDTGNVYENMFLAVDSEGKRTGPGVYWQEDNKVLIYKKENIINNDTLHLQVGQQNEFEDINVELK